MNRGTSPIVSTENDRLLLVRADAEHHLQVAEQGGQVERGGVQGRASRLDLGHLQDVVDQGQEVLAAAVDGPEVLALSGGEVPVAEHQLREPEDGVHRGADLVRHVGQEDALGAVGLLQRLLVTLALRDVAGGGEDPLQLPVAVVEGGRVVGHQGLLAVPGACGELVVGDLALAQHQLDAGLGALRVGEVALERGADQLVARASGQRLHLLVHVGDDAARVRCDQRINVRFDERPRVELLVAHALIEQHPLGFHLLARGIIGADQQVADDPPLGVAQRRDRDDGREAAAVLADVGQFVDVLDPARGLEDQGLEARGDRGPQLGAQGLGAGDHLLRIGDVGRGVLVHHLGGRITQHALGADVEDLDDALLVGGDAREVGAVEDGALQAPRLRAALLPPASAR